MVAPILLFAVGNESRGDDALGPLLLRRMAAVAMRGVECQEDYQWQVEHAADLAGRSHVLFIDADVACAPPFRFDEIIAAHDQSYTSHAMSPQALLHAYEQVYGGSAPRSFVLRIRGYDFTLGMPPAPAALDNLRQAESFLHDWLCRAGASHA